MWQRGSLAVLLGRVHGIWVTVEGLKRAGLTASADVELEEQKPQNEHPSPGFSRIQIKA